MAPGPMPVRAVNLRFLLVASLGMLPACRVRSTPRSSETEAAASIIAQRNTAMTQALNVARTRLDRAQRVGPGDRRDRFGAAAVIEGSFLAIGAPEEDDGARSAGAVYVFRFDGRWRQIAQITLAQTVEGDRFGAALAMDGERLAVGVPGRFGSGAAYIYVRDGDRWRLRGEVWPSDTPDGARFGASLVLRGSTLAVGAPGRDTVHVFERTATQWLESARVLPPPQTPPRADFGHALAIDGEALAVGAPAQGDKRGAAYVFSRSRGVWGEPALVVPQDRVPDAEFGHAIALSRGSLIVSAPGFDALGACPAAFPFACGAGGVFVFRQQSGSWTQDQLLVPQTELLDDRFGHALALSAERLLVSAPQSAVGRFSVRSGAVYGYRRLDDGRWLRRGLVVVDEADNGAELGDAVSLDGDRGVIGSPGADSLAGTAVAIEIDPAEQRWALDHQLSPSDAAPGDDFGRSLAFDYQTLAVGSPGDDNGDTDTGSVSLFALGDGAWTQKQKLTSASGQGASFGRSLALDEFRLAVGADFASNGSVRSGAAYLFVQNGGRWAATQTLWPSDAEEAQRFGAAAALRGGRVVVGAPWDGPGRRGAVYLFTLAGSTWRQEAKLFADGLGDQSNFGSALAFDGQLLVVGAPELGSTEEPGAVYLYRRTATGWQQAGRLQARDARAGAEFGAAVALDEALLLVGAPGQEDGRVHGFGRQDESWPHESTIERPSLGDAGRFGSALAVDATTLVVGVDYGDNSIGDRAAAHVYARSGSTWTHRARLGGTGVSASFATAVAVKGNVALVADPAAHDAGLRNAGVVFQHLLLALPLGQPCLDGSACINQTCVDGVCCESSCAAACEACDQEAGVGRCRPRPLGVIVAAGPAGGGCQGEDRCDGFGHCRKRLGRACSSADQCIGYRTDGQLRPGECVDGVCCNTAGVTDCSQCQSCDVPGHEGTCQALPSGAADFFPLEKSCFGATVCDGNSNCRQGLASACRADEDCASGHCADGVCCDGVCDGICESCRVDGNLGRCTAIVAGADPDGECIGTDLNCGGACDGAGQCEFPAAGARCGRCKACDGAGRCNVTPPDDATCGIVDCDQLDSECRDFQDLRSDRCQSFGRCKAANDPQACQRFIRIDCPASAVDNAGLTANDAEGCTVARGPSRRLPPEWSWLIVAIECLHRRRRRQRVRLK